MLSSSSSGQPRAMVSSSFGRHRHDAFCWPGAAATREKQARGLVSLNAAVFPQCAGAGVFVETERTPEIKDAFEMVASFYLDHKISLGLRLME